MTKPVGFDPVSGALVIAENGVFPACTLRAGPHPTWPDRIQIDSLAGRGEQTVPWQDVTSLDGAFVPASMDDALAYLRGEFAKRPPAGDGHTIGIAIAAPGQTTIPLHEPPTLLSSVRLEVNGLVYRPPAIAASDVAVTWLNGDFPLDPSDSVTVVYS